LPEVDGKRVVETPAEGGKNGRFPRCPIGPLLTQHPGGDLSVTALRAIAILRRCGMLAAIQLDLRQ